MKTEGQSAISSTSRARATFYLHGDDLVIEPPRRGKLETRGDHLRQDEPALVRVSCSKRMGAGPGRFTLALKVPPSIDLFDWIADDEWVDLELLQFGHPNHVMRGMVDRINPVTRTGGAESVTWMISCSEFARAYVGTEIFFNEFGGEIAGEIAARAWLNSVGLHGSVDEVVATYLSGFLRELNGLGRNLWDLPAAMPGITGTTLVETVLAPWKDDFSNDIARNATNPNWLIPPQSNLWALAQEWSDPEFTELYPELLVPSGVNIAGRAAARYDYPSGDTRPDQTRMAIVLRDKPFPTFTLDGGIRSALWYDLEEHTIPREQVRDPNVGRGGAERFNTFIVSPQLTQELTGNPLDFSVPLWDPVDIKRHGVRRLEMRTRYVANEPDLNLTVSRRGRQRLRDWHVLNAYFRAGTINTKPGRPEIRIGTRLRIPGAAGPESDTRYYVEGFDHDWDLEDGVTSSFIVSRGWKGTEESMIAKMVRMNANYTETDLSFELERLARSAGIA